jgi:hypothetical protein
MPRSPDDDATRWELPVWEDEVPARSSSEAGLGWDTERSVPRWQPRAGSAGRPDRTPTGTTTARSRVPPTRTALLARPLVWLLAHPWGVAWTLVVLAPGAALLLRALDESGPQVLVALVLWGLVGLFVVALTLAMLATAGRSAARLVLGTAAILAALGAVLWPVTRVTMGRTICPARAGGDLGATVAGRALQAWQRGAGGHESWRTGHADRAWLERSRALALRDYQLVDSGCWERAAPIDATRTWHDFRVTVDAGGPASLSKSLVVHTAVDGNGWKITAIEGPLP